MMRRWQSSVLESTQKVSAILTVMEDRWILQSCIVLVTL